MNTSFWGMLLDELEKCLKSMLYKACYIMTWFIIQVIAVSLIAGIIYIGISLYYNAWHIQEWPMQARKYGAMAFVVASLFMITTPKENHAQNNK